LGPLVHPPTIDTRAAAVLTEAELRTNFKALGGTCPGISALTRSSIDKKYNRLLAARCSSLSTSQPLLATNPVEGCSLIDKKYNRLLPTVFC